MAAALGLLMVSAQAIPASASTRLAAPAGLSVSFSKTLATFRWGAVPGATSYMVSVGKTGYYGPWVPYTTTSTSLNLAFTSFPYRGQAGTSYSVYVVSVAKGKSTGYSSTRFTVKPSGSSVKASDTSKALAKAKSCLKDGSVAALTTAATGAATLVATTFWIPGVDVVTAGGVALAAGASGAGTYVTCVAFK